MAARPLGGKVGGLRPQKRYQPLGLRFNLCADAPATDKNGGLGEGRIVKDGAIGFFHTDGGAAAPNVAGDPVDILYRNEIHGLFPHAAGRRFAIQLGCNRDDENKIVAAGSFGNQGFKYLL